MALSLGLGGCERRAAPAPKQTGRRSEAIRPAGGQTKSGFCEQSYPASGPKARPFVGPPERPLPGQAAVTPAPERSGWTWLNVWATWCVPCIEEMALLARWQRALAGEGRPLGLSLLSVDAPADGPALAKRIEAGLPGPVRWLRAPADLAPFLEGLGVGRDAAVPIHALIDPAGMLRCVRVGAIHPQDYGQVRALLAGA